MVKSARTVAVASGTLGVDQSVAPAQGLGARIHQLPSASLTQPLQIQMASRLVDEHSRMQHMRSLLPVLPPYENVIDSSNSLLTPGLRNLLLEQTRQLSANPGVPSELAGCAPAPPSNLLFSGLSPSSLLMANSIARHGVPSSIAVTTSETAGVSNMPPPVIDSRLPPDSSLPTSQTATTSRAPTRNSTASGAHQNDGRS
mmetsp:Transcript_20881/g.48233  ORF Transcript_20881/g.48233 Transcript_20881/m.48233 type:complete len:200 (+) Transcript_20881:125-724(+)